MNSNMHASIDPSHPRYESLKRRERLVAGYREGLVVPQGLIAHGRGEMFDYLLGEKTLPPASKAEEAAAAALLLAKRPVISVNGNVAALCPEEVVKVAMATKSTIEVNLFHWTRDRATLIRKHLEMSGAKRVLAENPDAVLDGIHHDRARCHKAGIFTADAVLIPLEDGDRAKALADMGKTVISVDLNPLSRTSQSSTISIVDEVTRALPSIARFSDSLAGDEGRIRKVATSYSNSSTLKEIYRCMSERLQNLLEADQPRESY